MSVSLIVPTDAQVIALAAWTGLTAAATPWALRLFSNNYTPVVTDTTGSYTEVTGGGYASIALVAATWVTTAGNPSSIAYPAQSFSFTGAIGGSGTVYGYYMTDSNGVLMGAQLLTTPLTPTALGDSVTINLVIAMGDLP
jgi:hypothetical protein